MSRARKFLLVALVALVFCIGFAAVTRLLFRGYFDRGLFEIKQAQWSDSKHVAVLVKRSDDEAMNGDVYFVLVKDQIPSSSQLRLFYHSDEPVFAADSDCLILQWKNANELVIRCKDQSVKVDDIEVEKHQIGDVRILYENIPAFTNR
jgi:hypothetical protein